MKKLISLANKAMIVLLCLCMVSSTVVSGESVATKIVNDTNILGTNDKYTLFLDRETESIKVVSNKDNTLSWNTIVTDEICDMSSNSEVFVNYMQSMIVIHYALNDDTNGNKIDGYSADKSNKCKITVKNNGADFDYDFEIPKISLKLEVRLTESGVSFKIPFNSIKEKGKYSLLSVEVAPFFSAAGKNENGYIFYPEGSGAITRFETAAEKSKSATEAQLDIYGNSDLETIMSEEQKPTATMPVYGIKRENSAFLAVITQGDANAKINVRPSVATSTLSVHCAGFEFTYLYQYTVYLSNIVKNGKNSAENINGSKVDENIIKGDREVQFFLLEKENADYSGMAVCYRNYLMKNNLMKQNKNAGYDVMSLTLLLGVKTEGELFGNNFVEMTTYSKAMEILSEYYDSGLISLQVNLRGWSKSGVGKYPQNYSPVSALGGKSKLKKLIQEMNEKNIPIVLENNVIYTTKSLFGIKGTSNLKATGIPVADDEEEIYLLSSKSALKRLKKGYKRIKRLGAGLSFDDIGKTIYYDYNSDSASRADTINNWKEAMSLTDYIAVQNANSYVFGYANWIFDNPLEQEKRLICDENIPFLAMVAYNSLNLTSLAGNYAYDFDELILKWIEYGCSPYFELTDKSPKLLRDTEYNNLFSSKNSEWKDKVINTYKVFSKDLKKLSDTYMVKHNIPFEQFVTIDYENGCRVLLNYSNETIEFDGYIVNAKSYKLCS